MPTLICLEAKGPFLSLESDKGYTWLHHYTQCYMFSNSLNPPKIKINETSTNHLRYQHQIKPIKPLQTNGQKQRIESLYDSMTVQRGAMFISAQNTSNGIHQRKINLSVREG